MKKFRFGIVIPTMNEDINIYPLRKAINKNLKNNEYFICFVDKSSDNKTIDEIRKNFKENFYIIKEKNNKKYISTRCYASYIGFKWLLKNIKCEVIIDLDADQSHDPREINLAYRFIKNGADLVIASKYLNKSKVIGRSFIRRIISYICTLSTKIIISKKISDFTNSYRFYKSSSLNKLLKNKVIYKSPVQNIENLVFFVLNNYKIVEIPTKYIERKIGNSSINIIGLFYYFFEFLLFLFNHSIKKINLFFRNR